MQALQLAQRKVTQPNFMPLAVFGFGQGQLATSLQNLQGYFADRLNHVYY